MIIRSVDVDSNMSFDFKINLENGRRDYLFVMFKSAAMLWSDGEYISVDNGEGVFFDKNQKQSYYGAADVEFIHDFLLFDAENEYEKALLSSIQWGKPFNIRSSEAISNAISLIKQEFIDVNEYKRESLSLLGQLFIYRVKNELCLNDINHKEINHYRAMQKLRSEIYHSPEAEWTIEHMCAGMYLSKYYFQRLYKDFFGTSVIQDVICARLEKAKNMLINSELSISLVGEKCGYKNTEHFIRQFKRVCGDSPRRFREKMLSEA